MSSRPSQPYRRASEGIAQFDVSSTFQKEHNRLRERRSARSQTQRITQPVDSPPTARAPPLKKHVEEPLTIFGFFVTFVVHLCRRYVLFQPRFKAPLYLFIVFLGSSLGDLFRPQKSLYLARPGNAVSVWLVQFAPYWTILLLLPFVLLTSYIYCGGKVKKILRNISRLLIIFIVHKLVLRSFDKFQTFSAFCSNEDYGNQKSCVGHGHRWMSFDVSDDAFSLIFLTLVIMEELMCFSRWEELDYALKRSPMDVLVSPEQSSTNAMFVRDRYFTLNGVIQAVFIALTLLCIIWDVMLVMTVFYYQSLPQKLSAALVAEGVWFVTYHLWYPRAWPYLPGLGIIRNLRIAALRKF
ncbi:acyl-coenzyme A diphosphatase FITM2-like isoform X1 [Paramacrobiotus metropolitanus]|uniref:acyl-coenzyme A diphosphatase FITM2-like isoform X1 n=1 Tax=Paramacrobiotus metropolitanus TaxID=2943436 RepID=UPI0024465393|nr:acyl-coenzyme A diphosphatase FITM2-like isoform X1 [Paramacrobiotus metropolitanus]